VQPVLERVRAGERDPRRVVLIDGVPHVLDVKFRMLQNPKLACATDFTDAEATYEFVGTEEEVTKQIGNAVECDTACALVTAILGDGQELRDSTDVA
jgi:hypothetical protein